MPFHATNANTSEPFSTIDSEFFLQSYKQYNITENDVILFFSFSNSKRNMVNIADRFTYTHEVTVRWCACEVEKKVMLT